MPQFHPHYLRRLALARQNTFQHNLKQHRDIPQKMHHHVIMMNFNTQDYHRSESTLPQLLTHWDI